MFCKKRFPKDLLKIIYLCQSQENLVQTLSYEFCRIFRSIYFVEHLWTHTCVKWSNEKIFPSQYIFTEKHRWGCHLKYSCRYEGLEFYLKGTQSQILSCKLYEVLQSFSFTEHYLLLGNCFWLPATFLPCYFFFTLSIICQFSHN